MTTNNTVIGDIVLHEEQDSALRIYYSTYHHEKYHYAVQVAPLLPNGDIKDQWTEVNDLSDSLSAIFEYKYQAEKFIQWLLSVNPEEYDILCSVTIENIRNGGI